MLVKDVEERRQEWALASLMPRSASRVSRRAVKERGRKGGKRAMILRSVLGGVTSRVFWL